LYDHGYDIHQMGWGNDGGDDNASVSSSSSVSSGEEERISVRRKRKNRGRKEEALYGVFATNDSHDTHKHGGTRSRKKHFTSGTVAFVKAAAKQDATTPDNEDNKDALMMDATTTPTTTPTMTTLEKEEWDELAESELNTNAMNAKFTQLVERSTTSTIPTMTAVPTTTSLELMTSISTTIQPPLEETKQLLELEHANENEDAFEEYRNQQKKNKSGFGLGYKPSSSSLPSSTNKDSVPTMKTTNDDTTTATTAAASVVTTQNQEERTTLNKKGYGKKLLEQADLASFFTSAQAQPPQRSNPHHPMKNAPKKDPNLGTWEKHTKGIGYKLLIKMGYEGSGGLGSKRRRRLTTTPTPTTGAATTTNTTTTTTASNENADATSMKKGISRPVEVVVRPANLGLGFGNFTEATRLKGNRQIEAEVRGIDWKKQEQENKQKQQEERKRLLPTTQDLLAHATDWKKQPHQTNKNKRRREKRKIISYQELVSTEEKEAKNNATTGSSKLHIIDLRGPTSLSTVPSLNADGTVPLGEELLHNVTLLLNTMENQLLSTSHLARSTKQRVASLQSDVHAMTQRIQDVAHRRTKLQTVLRIMDDIDALQSQASNHDNDDDHDHITVMTQVQGYIQKLHDNFTKEEKESLHFYNVLVPCLLGPFVEKRLVQWDPLGNSTLEHDQMMTSVWNLSPSPLTGQIVPSTGDESKWFTRRSIFVNHILPRAKRALQSSQWDPMSTVDDGLELYEAMLKGAAMASPPPMVSQSREEMEDVLLEAPMEQLYTSVDSVKEELMHETIYPKMSRSISAWKPVIDKKQQSLGECRLVNPLHLWVLPWLPHLDHKTILPTLLGDIKRKLRSSLSYLQGAKGIHETDFLSASFGILEPWRGILEKTTLQDLTSNSVVPRLDKYLCNMVISRESKYQDWSGVDILFKWHAAGLLADRELMSLVEGEVLCTWARALHAWLSLEESSEPTANFEQMSEFYADWKQKLLLDTHHGEKADGAHVVPAYQILRKDKMICQHFYACLLMIQSKMDNDADALDDLLPPFRESYNYRHAMARRVRDERIKEQEKEILQRGSGPAPRHFHKAQQHTFREVVEDYAREQNVSFTPRLGANSTKDGKPIFMFGTTPIYIDSNVVFALRKSKWHPTSLESLS